MKPEIGGPQPGYTGPGRSTLENFAEIGRTNRLVRAYKNPHDHSRNEAKANSSHFILFDVTEATEPTQYE